MSRFAVSTVRKLREAAADADRAAKSAHENAVQLRGLALQHFDESCEVGAHPYQFTPRHALDLARDPGFQMLVNEVQTAITRCAQSKTFAAGLKLMLTPQPGHEKAALSKELAFNYGEKLKMETLAGRMFDGWYRMLEALEGEFGVHPVHGRVVMIEPSALYDFVRRMLLHSGIDIKLTPHLETAFHKPFSAQEMMRVTVEVATQYVDAVDGNNSRNKRPAEDAVHKEEDGKMGQDAAEAKRRKAERAAAA
jgi:hypothetical protein